MQYRCILSSSKHPLLSAVLRGDKGRFQLFGDTVNVAARMESNGEPGRIHISQETAEILKEAGKESWVEPREDVIMAKGKGQLNTFWLIFSGSDEVQANQTSTGISEKLLPTKKDRQNSIALQNYLAPGKHHRLVEWNTEVRKSILRLVP